MQKSPTIATGAQKIRLDENGDLMVFVHLANMRRIDESFQNSDGRYLMARSHRRFLAVMARLDRAIHAPPPQNDPGGLGDRPESSEAIRFQTMGAVARTRGWPRQARP
jgi:hypothetical protein